MTEVGGQARLLQATCMTNRQHWARPCVYVPMQFELEVLPDMPIESIMEWPINAYLLVTKAQLFECFAGFRHDSF